VIGPHLTFPARVGPLAGIRFFPGHVFDLSHGLS
jgi:hypothetical protein